MKYYNLLYIITTNTEAVVGLQRTFYQVDEDVGVVEVCLSVIRPNILCPVTYPFDVLFITVADSAGKNYILYWFLCIMDTNVECVYCCCSQWKVMIMDDSLIWYGLLVVSEDAVLTSLLLRMMYWRMLNHSI